jgi:hypothetical protein
MTVSTSLFTYFICNFIVFVHYKIVYDTIYRYKFCHVFSGMTIGLVNGFMGHLYTPCGNTFYRSLTHRDYCTQSATMSHFQVTTDLTAELSDSPTSYFTSLHST